VTLSETFDTFEAVIADAVIGGGAAVDDDRPEPTLAASPFFIEFDEPVRLDPDRAGLIWELQPVSARPIWWRSPLVSLAFHLLPVVAIILFPLLAIEPPAQIPVQLVFEQPPPPPPPQPQPQPAPKQPQLQQPPRGPLSSVDQGAVKPLDMGRTTDPVPPPTAGEQRPNPAETQTATAAEAPPIPQPKPAPPKEQQPSVHLPKPSGAPNAQHAEIPHEAPRAGRYAGPAASRDEYLAYLVALTRQHMGLLQPVVGDRHGETVISVVVYDNGTIGPIGVIRGSNYPDIDQRIEEMVAAVHKFPPLPQWYQGNAVQLELTLKFPEALEQR
jgi:protein TonB